MSSRYNHSNAGFSRSQIKPGYVQEPSGESTVCGSADCGGFVFPYALCALAASYRIHVCRVYRTGCFCSGPAVQVGNVLDRPSAHVADPGVHADLRMVYTGFIRSCPAHQQEIKMAGDSKVEPEIGDLKTIDSHPLYIPANLQGWDYDRDVGYPGEFPYTRGVQTTMYRGRLWTMRQYAGMGDADESNKRYKYLLAHGTTGLSVAFDLPTQIGLDSDHPLAQGEVGKVGVAIDSVEDMERLFEGIDLTEISTSMTINATASILLALYVAVARRKGADIRKLSGTVQNDILKEYIARGTYIYPVSTAMRIVTDLFAWANKNVPDWNTISISGYHMREAGATAVQEVAFTLANGSAYVQAAVDAGLDVDVFGPRISFFFNAHSNFLEEVAKFRAARRMWAHIMRENFGAKNPRSWMLRFHTQTAGSTLTAQQPENNIVRTAIQAMAAVLGGTQSLHTNSFDEALSLPTQQAARIALRTQQVVAYESGVANTIDPFAGS